jgi:ATP synthase protein I
MSGNEGDRKNTPGDPSFEARLRAARDRQGLDAPKAASAAGAGPSSQPSPMGVGLRVGVELVSALAVALAIGWYLDKWLHTSPFLLIVFVLLGGAAGVANVWRLMGPARPRS